MGFHVLLCGNSLVGECMVTVHEAAEPLNPWRVTKRKSMQTPSVLAKPHMQLQIQAQLPALCCFLWLWRRAGQSGHERKGSCGSQLWRFWCSRSIGPSDFGSLVSSALWQGERCGTKPLTLDQGTKEEEKGPTFKRHTTNHSISHTPSLINPSYNILLWLFRSIESSHQVSGDLKTFLSRFNAPQVYWLVHVSDCPLVWDPSCPVKGSRGMTWNRIGVVVKFWGSAGPSEGERQGQGSIQCLRFLPLIIPDLWQGLLPPRQASCWPPTPLQKLLSLCFKMPLPQSPE